MILAVKRIPLYNKMLITISEYKGILEFYLL